MPLSPRRLRIPEENGTMLVEPPFAQAPDLLAEHRPDFDIGGQSAAALRQTARAELLAAARRYTAAYRDVAFLPSGRSLKILLAGHQPQMFHPGVWLKNFALGRLAERHGAVGISLIIDSDVARPTALRTPGGTAENPEAAWIPFDRPDPAISYEERRLEDADLFASFAERVRQRLEPLVAHPLLTSYWPIVQERLRATGHWGAAVAQARHRLEAAWGLHTLEIPQSVVCDLPAFHFFLAFLLAELPRFLPVYNGAVTEYRRQRRIRSKAHPVPDLAVDGGWHEAPFWIWTADDPRRRRLFARQTAGKILISDRAKFEARLPGNNPLAAAERLAELRRRGLRIRSRALITTLWARLFLGELFLHGIGGGNYDQVTDRIIERFFHVPPPAMMILSATLHLPVPEGGRTFLSGSSNLEETDKNVCPPGVLLRTTGQQLRELTYHPERFLDAPASPEVESLVSEKRRRLAAPPTCENARAWCHAIRGINQQLQSHLEQVRRKLLLQQTTAEARAKAEKILRFREYAFCLYPEETLRPFLARLLAEV
ncbi:MAG: hypothetical protein JXB10_19645 [Pirellulales bacterium]|nr:hypothetical protein [Pirellulales bacterium]